MFSPFATKSCDQLPRLAVDCDLTETVRRWARSPYAWTFFFFTAFIVFSSFFLEGKALLSSSDHTFGHYPNLIYGHRMLRQGDFGLWNPLIFNGIDFSTSFHHHMLHPLNWPLLLLPEHLLLLGVTFQCYLEISLIGLLAFRIVRCIEDDEIIALFVALVAQLGGFAWFTTTTLIGTHLLFAAAAAIYVIVSSAGRRAVLNYVYLTLCFFDILMMGHVAYIAAFGLPVVVVFFLWTWPQSVLRPWRGLMLTVTLAFLTAGCMSAVRIWPVMQGLIFEQNVVDTLGFPSLKDSGYFALTGFAPEVMGLHHGDTVRFSEALGLGGRHIQFHNLLYYGIAPVLLLWLSMLRGLGSKSFTMTALYLAVALTPLYLLQPLSDLVNIAIFPVHHDIICRTGGMFLMCAALVPILKSVRDHGVEADDWRLRWFISLTGIVLACCVAFFVRVSQARPELVHSYARLALLVAKVCVVVGLPVCFVAVGRVKLNALNTGRITNITAILFAVALVVLGALSLHYELFFHTWITLRGFAFTVASGLWGLAVIWTARAIVNKQALTRRQWGQTIAVAVVALGVCLLPIPEYYGSREASVLLISGVSSMTKFAFFAAVALEIVVLCGSSVTGRRQLIPLLGLLTVGELVGHTKLYSHCGTQPFIAVAELYPKRHRHDLAHSDWVAAGKDPSLLENPRFQRQNDAPTGWSVGGSQSATRATQEGLILAATAADGSTLYQDIKFPEALEALTMGAWVRSTSAVPIKLALNADVRGAESAPYAGNGAWEWLEVTVLHPGIRQCRPHVILAGMGELEIAEASLCKGVVSHVARRPTGDAHVTPLLTRAEEGPPMFDVKNYRVNKPTQVLRWQDNEVISNINVVYGVPTYAGVDSDVKKNLTQFFGAFDGNPPGWNPRCGIFGTLTSPRAMDLSGVKYDWDGKLVVRPDAISRVSLFKNYEVHTDKAALLARLNAPDFKPTETLLLSEAPPQPPAAASRFEPVEFEARGSSLLSTRLTLAEPAMLLFNDSYSPYWTFTCNGKPLHVISANGNFMAVSLPAGVCDVTWKFSPTPMMRLFWLSMAGTAILAGAACTPWLTRKRQPVPAVNTTEAPQRLAA